MSGHEPVVFASTQGCWARCTCNTWRSRRTYTTVSGAHLEYGLHLLGKETGQ